MSTTYNAQAVAATFDSDRYSELVNSYEDAIDPESGDPELAAQIAATFLEEFQCEIEFQF